MKVSIIIPTFNEEKYLPKLLDCLVSQTFRDFEIIVADADSNDDTVTIAKANGALVVPGGMPGVGRNRGAEYANGEYLFFLDSDIQVRQDFLEQAVAELDDRNIEIATCEAEPLSDLKIDKIIHKFANIFIKLYKDSNPRVPGYCILIKKSLFETIGGFNEAIKVAEDHDLVKRATEYSPLKIVRKTQIYVSVRRFAKEGRLPYIGKSLQIALHRTLRGEITDDSIEYDFGNFESQDDSVVSKTLLRLEAEINNLDKKVTELMKQNNGTKESLRVSFENLGKSIGDFITSLGQEERK